jgi:uncharacterized protein (TIGR01319 family)
MSSNGDRLKNLWESDKESLAKLRISPEKMNYILVTDVGSTTTKSRFFKKINGVWRYIVSGEAPTTVEAPFEDVRMGVRNAIREVEELTGHKILLKDEGIIVPYDGEKGVDLYCTTSSAGGGLQMMVAGVVKTMTAESANRAALGAGAIVMDIIAVDDGRADYQKIKKIRELRPDMILLAGGTDGGDIKHLVSIAQLIKTADPKPRLGISYTLPLVYGGNKDAWNYTNTFLGSNFVIERVDNIRPQIDIENTEPARRAIHELFMDHVMSHAPGYLKLMKWTDIDILPTPAGEGMAVQLISKVYNTNVLGVGLGGATTNIYSIFDGRFVRSVSANLGMSYSICNVLKEAGIDNVVRWIPFDIDRKDLVNMLGNKMIRPTTIPHTLRELLIEHALAREALRLGLLHHKSIATRLKGVKTFRGLSGMFEQEVKESYIDMLNINIIVGTGGLLSHAPRRVQSLQIMNDGFQIEGVTRLFQDSVFMMPHLGLLSTVHPMAAWQIFDRDCLVRLGTVIAPKGETTDGRVLDIELTMPSGEDIKKTINGGELLHIPLSETDTANAVITPNREFDVGLGSGKKMETQLYGGKAGIIIDTRGRPITFPEDSGERIKLLKKWFSSLDLYPYIE